MTLTDIPADSLLHKFIQYMSWTESALSFQVAGGLSAIGAVLRRQRWFNQQTWRVWPNQSVMFIGPSGVGKDTIIDQVGDTLAAVKDLVHLPVLGGTTFESISCRLVNWPNPPTSAYIPLPEMSTFFGKADYQRTTITMMTNMLSGGLQVDISTKGDLIEDSVTSFEGRRSRRKTPQIVIEPTITVHAGSTLEWLHNALPAHSMEGGFLGRFLILVEPIGDRFVSIIGRGRSAEETAEREQALAEWKQGLANLILACEEPCEMQRGHEVEQLYDDWYQIRHSLFSKEAGPYAHRARDIVLRLAMQMALSRGHTDLIEPVDMAFAISMVNDVAKGIDAVIKPGAGEDLMEAILDFIPSRTKPLAEIYAKFLPNHSREDIDKALADLVRDGVLSVMRGESPRYERRIAD